MEEKITKNKGKLFINGDLIEKFVKLPISQIKKIYEKIKAPKPTLQELLIFIGQLAKQWSKKDGENVLI